MGIRICNDLTRKEEDFVPLEPGKVRFYNCGPTVYDFLHIGNARNFVVFDSSPVPGVPGLSRYLRPELHRHRRPHDQARPGAGNHASPNWPRR